MSTAPSPGVGTSGPVSNASASSGLPSSSGSSSGSVVSGIVGGLVKLATVGFGKSQAQKDADRVTRGNELYGCVILQGDATAAREIWFGAENTHSDSPVGVAHYKQLWNTLLNMNPRPAAVTTALGMGKIGDTTGKGCPGASELAQPMGLAPLTTPPAVTVQPPPLSPIQGVTPTSPAAAAVASVFGAGGELTTPVVLGGVALLIAALIF